MTYSDSTRSANLLTQINRIDDAIANAVDGIASYSTNGKSVTLVPVTQLFDLQNKMIAQYKRLCGQAPMLARGRVEGINDGGC